MARRRLPRSKKYQRLGTAPEPIKILPITLPESVYAEVARVASRLNWSKAEFCRQAIDNFLAGYKEAAR
jgi:hypothetical protein